MNENSFVNIRKELPEDYSKTDTIIQKAFENEIHSEGTEHLLVQKLRESDSFIPELSLVAELNDNLVGHILLTKVHIRNETTTFKSLALAPVSVLPEFQRQGIGSRLIKTSHQKAKNLGFTSVVLIGHENYYLRFGYKPAHIFDISFPFDAPPENCMAVELTQKSLAKVSGEVIYPETFFNTL